MIMRIPRHALAILAASLLATASMAGTAPAPTAAAAPAPAAPLNLADHTLLSDSLALNQLEVDVSEYAAAHASTDKVRKFAQQMVTEHTQLGVAIQKANDGLVPAPPKSVQPDESLAGQKGDAFDRVYVSIMAADDETLVMKFGTVPDGTLHQPSIRDMAKNVLPTLRRLAATSKGMANSL